MTKSMKRKVLTEATVMVLMSTAAPAAMAAPAMLQDQQAHISGDSYYADYRDCWISPICGIWPR
jgi:hypothetical protein